MQHKFFEVKELQIRRKWKLGEVGEQRFNIECLK